MPVVTGKDTKGCFAKWGAKGKKYYYTCGSQRGMEQAKEKASKQGQAVKANKYKNR